MPARDPATSPHLPSHASAPSVPAAPHSASSSAFSRTGDSPAAREPGLVAGMLRRVSTGHAPAAPGANGHDDVEALAPAPARGESADVEDGPFYHAGRSAFDIRESSNRLASMSFSARSRGFSVTSDDAPRHAQAQAHRPPHPSHLNPRLSEPLEESPPNPSPAASPAEPSGISVMLRRNAGRAGASPRMSGASLGSVDNERTPLARPVPIYSSPGDSGDSGEVTPRASVHDIEAGDEADASGLRRHLAGEVDERSPLLGGRIPAPLLGRRIAGQARHAAARLAKVTPRDIVRECIAEPAKALPAVILGLLLNVLDGVSYGMILFPASPVFPDFGSLGVSMFFMSCIVSQLTFSLGGSIFRGGNGSMMIEAVPFFHILVNIIQNRVGDDAPAIIATTMASFAFSALLTGAVFFALGAFRLGALIGYFPRHILVGCIGGVGIFLLETGLEVSRGLKEDGFEYSLATLKMFFEDVHAVALWTIPLALAISLRVITHFFHHQLIFPAYFFIIPIVFYVVVAAGRWNLDRLRETGWVFDVGANTQAWWKFYTLYDFHKTNWEAFWEAMPTQLALVFFGILHVPLNVPALGVSLGEDNVRLDRELVAHGVSNFAAGLVGTVPNYLCYVNTVLFYRVGGGSRLSGIMLAVATAMIMFVGPTAIGYLPVMVVGALIFVLGIDLVVEAVWDTRHRVNRSEYVTIWAIAIGMTIFDFVIGLLLGIILACVFFVVQSSRRRAIRAVFDGATAKSTVRRPREQRAFLQNVGSQTHVMKLQGFLFFGTITTVEDAIRKLLDLAEWQHTPIRFCIIDFALVHGLDFSSAEAFVRVQRLLAAKDVLLILCGANPDGLVGTALRAVDLWADREGSRVEVFATLNDALEWTENAYLTAFYEGQSAAEDKARNIDFPKVARPPFSLAASFENSPRRRHLATAGDDTLPAYTSAPKPSFAQPLPILLQTFSAYTSEPPDFFTQLTPYFTSCAVMAGDTLWAQGDRADGLYLIERGALRATYAYADHAHDVQETMVAGTVAGDLSMLSDTRRNATVVAERDCALWKLAQEGLDRLESEKPDIARRFVKIVLKAAAEEVDVLASHLIAVLS